MSKLVDLDAVHKLANELQSGLWRHSTKVPDTIRALADEVERLQKDRPVFCGEHQDDSLPENTSTCWMCAWTEEHERAEDGLALREAWIRDEHEIQQVLGRALGYPRFADDQKNFPGATDSDGVAVGEHVAATLAQEAAKSLARWALDYERQKERAERLREAAHEMDWANQVMQQQGPGVSWMRWSKAAEEFRARALDEGTGR